MIADVIPDMQREHIHVQLFDLNMFYGRRTFKWMPHVIHQ